MAIFKRNRTGSLLLLCSHAIERSDVNMFNHRTGFKSSSSQLSEKQARSWFGIEWERKDAPLVLLAREGWLGRSSLLRKDRLFPRIHDVTLSSAHSR